MSCDKTTSTNLESSNSLSLKRKMMSANIIIRGRIPSKKNSHFAKNVRGKICVFPNTKYQERENNQIKWLMADGIRPLKLNKPLKVVYKFRFPDSRKTDLSNKLESINDLLVRYGLFADDNHEILACIEATSMGIDKESPRCEIELYEITKK